MWFAQFLHSAQSQMPAREIFVSGEAKPQAWEGAGSVAGAAASSQARCESGGSLQTK